jgi:hypothetical protein
MAKTLKEYYQSKQDGLQVNLNDTVMEWAREHAQEVPLGAVLTLIARVQNVASGHARDLFNLGRNSYAFKDGAQSDICTSQDQGGSRLVPFAH